MRIVKMLARAFASGTGAAVTSAVAASREAVKNGASAVAPINAVSHCVWPAEAFLDERPSVRFVDYHVVPERVTPGFEAHVAPRSFLPIYAAFGAGLALVALARRGS
jgi:hypothetical protein